MARYRDETLMKAVGEYLDVHLPLTRDASPNTVDSYSTAVDLYDLYLRETGGADEDERVKKAGLRGSDVSCLSAKNLLGFLEWLRYARGNSFETRELRLTAIIGLIDYVVTLDISKAALLVEAQKVRSSLSKKGKKGKIVGHMTERAWDVLSSQPRVTERRTEHRNWVFMALMYETACRNQEVIDLRVRDVVFDAEGGPVVYVMGKGRKERLIPIRESCAKIVRDYVARFHGGDEKSDAPLFYTRHGGVKCRMSPDTPEKFLDRYGKAARAQYAGVPEKVHPHLIRHTRAVHLLEGGMTIEDLSKLLGHKDVATTKVYIQSSAEAKRAPMAKAQGKDPSLPAKPGFWEGDEGIIARLENPRKR